MKYRISYKEPHKHFADIELQIDSIRSDKTYIQLPAWRPGRYELQNYARNIQKFEVFDAKGDNIPFRKVSRDRWEVDTVSKESIVVKYNYYCYQMDAGGCWLDENQLYLNFICCAVYVPRRESEPCSVQLDIPENYLIACGLHQKDRELLAGDFYHLADAPLIASADLQHTTYTVQNIPFHIWILGDLQPDWNRIVTDFQKFTEENINVFGEFPEKDYHFLFQILPFRQYHGVEHRNSTVITLGPAENFHEALYESLLGVSCHELFHAWNALKIRPKEMMPYDFSRENYFRTGYVIEGVTTYYGDLLLIRSGVFSLEQFFKEINNLFKKHFENFGRFNLSLADSSYDLWVDGYTPGIPNRKVSIYNEGAIAALILDLEIRKTTSGQNSLDDVMKYMWEEFGKKQQGYSEEDYQNAVEKIACTSFKNYFEECIYGTVSLENRLNEALNYAGCELSILPGQAVSERAFGFRTVQRENKTFVDLIEPGSPADRLLVKDDIILSIDGAPVENNMCELLWEKEAAEIVILRLGKTFQKTLSADKKNYLNQYFIRKRENASEEEKGNFKGWVKVEF